MANQPKNTSSDKVDRQTRSRIMSSIRSTGNKSTERRMRAYLVRAGIRGWRLNPKGIPGKPDFVFDQERVAIFIDGCFWHGCPRCFRPPKASKEYWETKIDYNRARDARKTRQLSEAGWCVLRFWEHELKEQPKQVLDHIRQVVTGGAPVPQQ